MGVLQEIPSVGKATEKDLRDIGIMKVSDLKGKNPEDLYKKTCTLAGIKVDRCVLYTYRCAVYYASNKTHDPELLKWWNWKDK